MKKIAEVAKKYLGQTEKPNNAGFTDSEFERRMRKVGFQTGQAWCCYFAELVCKEALPDEYELLDKNFAPSATATFKNFDLLGETTKKPNIGSLAVWRYGLGWQGHIGIVSKIIDVDTFFCIEGNTNDKGGREGYIVAERERKLNAPFSQKGLNLIGFIHFE